ncbi:MAG: hypothetical protein ACK421_02800 [Pseudanabaenaceae cyanobacterium]
MREWLVSLYQRGRQQLKEWWQFLGVTGELIINPHRPLTREKFAATLARLDILPIVEAVTDFLGDLPLWFY